MRNHYRNASLLFAALIATACATSSVYQPRTPGSTVGYTALQLSPNRYRVTYAGDFNNTRDDVDTNLLRHAAEVTLQNGYTHFVVQTRQTQQMIEYPYGPYPYYGRYYYPYYGGDNWVRSRFSSYAEILMLNDAEANNAANAVDAGRVLVSLNALPEPTVRTAAAAKE